MNDIGLFSITFASAALLSLLIGPHLIAKITALKAKQPIRDCGPESHNKKAGTPTLGGLMIIPVIALVSGIASYGDPRVLAVLGLMLWFSLVGFMDDWAKIAQNHHQGLRGKKKLLLESVGTVVFVMAILGLKLTSYDILLPFVQGHLTLGPVTFTLFSTFVIVGTANAVNLTDGLDGLVIVPVALVATLLATVAYLSSPVLNPLAMLGFTTAGASLAFLWFNAHPARIFMGDVGSLGLGGLLAGLAVIQQLHLLLVIAGALFVIETLSVIIQVVYFKATGGKRIFKMAPIHHHFELSGWSENKIVASAWLFTGCMVFVSSLHFTSAL